MPHLTYLLTALLLTLLLGACGPSHRAPGGDADATATVAPPAVPASSGESEVRLREQHAAGDSANARQRPLVARKQVAADALFADQAATYAPPPLLRQPSAPGNRERYAAIEANGVRLVREAPVSTFSIDVDTGAYTVVRRYLNQGILPPTAAVRTEELLNYFSYDYPPPRDSAQPFSVTLNMAPTPWNTHTRLVQVGLKGFQDDATARPASNLVFLIDVSGSMNQADKLPLLKNAFRLLARQLDGNDKVTLVVYAGASGVALETTRGDQQANILAALDRLRAGGATHGAAGIQLAYAMAEQAFIKDGINRVVLATDGDFNVGTVDHQALIDLIERNKAKGISLTTLGFGQGNYNDHLMEQLADHGDGNYAYIDSVKEAHKVLVQELSATLQTIARDVKIQVEWNPARVSEYRLIGYENRLLKREDFNNDKVDAGDIGAGHTVTALYEITLADSDASRVDPLRYTPTARPEVSASDELAFVKLRYKLPGETQSRLISRALLPAPLDSASPDLRFAAAVAAFGEQLRGGENLGSFGLPQILALARNARGTDHEGYRAEFIQLVALAAALDSHAATPAEPTPPADMTARYVR